MSTESNAARLADFLTERFEDDLRAVGGYWQREKISLVYLRDDLEAKADETLREDWARELLLESLSQSVKEDTFQMGFLDCTIQFFEEATVINFHIEEGSGVGATFDPDSVEITRTFIERCRNTAGIEK